jgi:hypothetical protein
MTLTKYFELDCYLLLCCLRKRKKYNYINDDKKSNINCEENIFTRKSSPVRRRCDPNK